MPPKSFWAEGHWDKNSPTDGNYKNHKSSGLNTVITCPLPTLSPILELVGARDAGNLVISLPQSFCTDCMT